MSIEREMLGCLMLKMLLALDGRFYYIYIGAAQREGYVRRSGGNTRLEEVLDLISS